MPTGQSMHSAAPCDGWYCPGRQGAHTSVPLNGVWWPASHIWQYGLPVLLAAIPTGQSVHAVAPGELEYEPARHIGHVLFRPYASLAVPSPHGRQLASPVSAVYEPGGHTSHTVWLLSDWNSPAEHGTQLVALVAGCTKPAGHTSHEAWPG